MTVEEIPTNVENIEDFSLLNSIEIFEKMIKLSKNGQYPQKEFVVENKSKLYTSYLHFTTSPKNIPNKKIKQIFKCIFCDVSNLALIGSTSNVKKHLERYHKQLDNWFISYNLQHKWQQNILIDKKILNLVKYFISSNTAASELYIFAKY